MSKKYVLLVTLLLIVVSMFAACTAPAPVSYTHLTLPTSDLV